MSPGSHRRPARWSRGDPQPVQRAAPPGRGGSHAELAGGRRTSDPGAQASDRSGSPRGAVPPDHLDEADLLHLQEQRLWERSAGPVPGHTGHPGDNHPGYDPPGYDPPGYDRPGHDDLAYPELGDGGRGFDADGYDADGYDHQGFDCDGYDIEGYHRDGHHEDDAGGYGPPGAAPHGRGGRSGGPGRGRRRPVRTVVLAVVVAVLVLVVAAGLHISGEINPGGGQGRLVKVTIPANSSSARIGQILAGADVIHGPSLFRYYVKLKGAGPLLPGTYTLPGNESYDAVISSLTTGPPRVVERLTIPEGYTLRQIASKVEALPTLGLSAARFLAAGTSGMVRSPFEPAGVNNLEGLVFPATYNIMQGMTEVDVLQTMVARFNAVAAAAGLTQGAAALGMTPYQVVTVGSIVEREAKLNADRGPVASTIYNRLKKGTTLGADSTLVYALRQANPSVPIGSIDYNQPNPFNTRLNKGLPPTPIANSGMPSISAAASPPATTYLYFVEVNPSGQLGFATTSAGFNQLVVQCRAAHLC